MQISAVKMLDMREYNDTEIEAKTEMLDYLGDVQIARCLHTSGSKQVALSIVQILNIIHQLKKMVAGIGQELKRESSEALTHLSICDWQLEMSLEYLLMMC